MTETIPAIWIDFVMELLEDRLRALILETEAGLAASVVLDEAEVILLALVQTEELPDSP